MFPEYLIRAIHPTRNIMLKLKSIPYKNNAIYLARNILYRLIGLLTKISIVPESTSSATRGAPKIPKILVKTMPNVQERFMDNISVKLTPISLNFFNATEDLSASSRENCFTFYS